MKQIAAALIKAQKSMSNAIKDSTNPFFKSKYADLNSVREACIPALNENGIVLLQPIIFDGGKSFVKTLLLHESGEMLESLTEVVCSKSNDAQAYGSALTYARRYGMQSMVNIGCEDDDGNVASGTAKSLKNNNNNSAPATAATPAPNKWLNKFSDKAQTVISKDWQNALDKLKSGAVTVEVICKNYILSKASKDELLQFVEQLNS